MSSSTDAEPAPHHCITDAQCRVCLDELTEARHQLDPERRDRATRNKLCNRSRYKNNTVREMAGSGSTARTPRGPEPMPRHHLLVPAHVTSTATSTRMSTSTAASHCSSNVGRITLVAAAMLLHGYPEAATPEERRVQQQLKTLLEMAVAQLAESFTSAVGA
jgi:hypothetical protein